MKIIIGHTHCINYSFREMKISSGSLSLCVYIVLFKRINKSLNPFVICPRRVFLVWSTRAPCVIPFLCAPRLFMRVCAPCISVLYYALLAANANDLFLMIHL